MATVPITDQRWEHGMPDWRNDGDVSPHPNDVAIRDAEGWQRTVAVVVSEFHDWPEIEARANLIAAAPEMLVALLGVLRAFPDAEAGRMGIEPEDAWRARAGIPPWVRRIVMPAIAKAEGRTDA